MVFAVVEGHFVLILAAWEVGEYTMVFTPLEAKK